MRSRLAAGLQKLDERETGAAFEARDVDEHMIGGDDCRYVAAMVVGTVNGDAVAETKGFVDVVKDGELTNEVEAAWETVVVPHDEQLRGIAQPPLDCPYEA